jgi:hypothetical protein
MANTKSWSIQKDSVGVIVQDHLRGKNTFGKLPENEERLEIIFMT